MGFDFILGKYLGFPFRSPGGTFTVSYTSPVKFKYTPTEQREEDIERREQFRTEVKEAFTFIRLSSVLSSADQVKGLETLCSSDGRITVIYDHVDGHKNGLRSCASFEYQKEFGRCLVFRFGHALTAAAEERAQEAITLMSFAISNLWLAH